MTTSDRDHALTPATDDAPLRALDARYAGQLAAQAALIDELRHRAERAEQEQAARTDAETDADTDTSKERVEALSDGVFAVAITLLVLDLHVPGGEEIATRGIWGSLGDRWPNYLGFALSFLLIGQVWANHRTMFGFIQRIDPTIVVWNTLLLMNIATLPFCTALLTANITQPTVRQAGLLVYTGALTIGGVIYNALWFHAARRRRLLVSSLGTRTVRTLSRNYLLGPTLYAVAFALALVNGVVSLALCIILVPLYLAPGFTHRFRRRD